jgi:hypothetical protein
VRATSRIDTPQELEFFRHGGLLPFVYRELTSSLSKSPQHS